MPYGSGSEVWFLTMKAPQLPIVTAKAPPHGFSYKSIKYIKSMYVGCSIYIFCNRIDRIYIFASYYIICSCLSYL